MANDNGKYANKDPSNYEGSLNGQFSVLPLF